MKILFFALLTVVLSISLHSAYGQNDNSLTINTDKTEYSIGDIIYVSGKTKKVSFGEEINLMVLAPDGNIISIEKLFADSNKKFQSTLTTTSSSIKSSGTYTLLAMLENENIKAETKFTIKPSSIIPELEAGETNVLLNFDFKNPTNQNIQEHIDYKVTLLKNGNIVSGPLPLTHSTTGEVRIPVQLVEGQAYDVLIEVYGILFRSIPIETSSFSITDGLETIQTQFTSKKGLKISLAVNKDPSPERKAVPDWVKTNAKWWANGRIDDNSFVQAIQFLVKEKIINISEMPYPATWMDGSVPTWVKSNASWWADGLIPEGEFIKGIKFLVEKGVIQI